MGKRPRVSWQKSQNVGKTQNRRLSGGLLALYILYAAALSMLFLLAASRMAEDRFGPLLKEEGPGCLWAAVLVIPMTLVWNEVLYNLGKSGLRFWGNLVLLLAAPLGLWYHYREQAEELTRGFYGLGQRYLDAWNRYFLTSLRMDQATFGSEAQEQLAWTLLLTAATIFLQILSALLRKRSVLLLLPAAVLAAEMAVGLTPEWPGMAWMFAAGILGLHLDCHREFQPVLALTLAGLLALLLPLTAAVLEEPASRVSLAHDRLQAFQHRVEREIRDYDWQSLFTLRRDGQLGNRRPEYTHREVMTVTVSTLPAGNLYLRGYYGAEYQRGSWSTGKKDFDRACRRYGIDGGEAAVLLAGLCGTDQASGSVSKVQYELEYTGLRGREAYLPYGADPESIRDCCRISGDYLAEKARGLKSLTFEGYASGSMILSDMGAWNPDVQNFYSWYNEYVTEHYLTVPEGLRELTEAVNSIAQSDACRIAREGLKGEDVAGRNLARLLLGNLVAQELQSRTRYNIDPGSLPQGVDPVEYFLGENRQGYCMHFATAGALLLRQLGVPARFASGYVVTPDQFRRALTGYRASVRDDASHAWVEIWLEEVGWVPVEMTPGYGETGTSLTAQGQQETVLPPETQQQHEADDRGEAQQEPPESMDGQEADASPIPSAKPQDSPRKGQEVPVTAASGSFAEGAGSPGASGGPDAPEGWGFAGEGGWAIFGQNGSLRVSHVALALSGILAAASLVWLVVFRLLRRRSAWWEKVRADIENGSARSAVKVINRRLYKRLRRRRAGIPAPRSDQEYLEALRRQYPKIGQKEWERYLEVVRKAVYSREEIGPEQAGECYALFGRTGAKEGRVSHGTHSGTHNRFYNGSHKRAHIRRGDKGQNKR